MLKRSGKSVEVLEARGYVGGRMLRQEVEAGGNRGWIDLGGQWVGLTQRSLNALIDELGLRPQVFDQYKLGATVLWYGGKPYLDDNEVPAPDGEARAAAEKLSEQLVQLAKDVVPDTAQPWASPQAADHDRITLGQWIGQNSADEYARFYVGWEATFNQSGGSPREVSLLHSLFELAANPPDQEPDKDLLTGAAGQIPPILAEQLGNDAVKLNSRVVAIDQGPGGITVTALTHDGPQEYKCTSVIVAVPPSIAAAIRYTSSVPGLPDLPVRRIQLAARMAMGTIAKIACIYPVAWWRHDWNGKKDLSGASLSNEILVGATADSGPLKSGPGVLTSFIQGDSLVKWAAGNDIERKQAVINDLVTLFGDQAANPTQYVEKIWPQEQFTGGAYNGYLPPGGWTSYGQAIRAPHGRIFWAGTETATQWYGYFDGAISAGERAATEVLT
jgi:L-amino acid dehydrogenase